MAAAARRRCTAGMIVHRLPSADAMYAALERRDPAYEGVFFVGVKTTGIFCRPTCSARKPRRENVEFYRSAQEALSAGFRPCRRCRPLEPAGAAPAWLRPLLAAVEAEPQQRWSEAELRARALDPERVRRWFQSQHGMTFHAYARARRLSGALDGLRRGQEISHASLDSGFASESGFRAAFGRWFGAAPSHARDARTLHLRRILTPLGPMLAAATDRGVLLFEFATRRMLETQLRRARHYEPGLISYAPHPHLAALEDELRAYFAGRLRVFQVPLDARGTPFQEQVWGALRAIPHGVTRSYEQIARAIGRPAAVRAVGRANGDNRLAILIPCHRVVASDGSLCGYGGGLWRKQRLLDLERGQLDMASA